MPQTDGYADYVDQQVRSPGQHRSQRDPDPEPAPDWSGLRRDTGEQDFRRPEPAPRGSSGRGPAGRGPAARGSADRGSADRGSADRGSADRGSAGHDGGGAGRGSFARGGLGRSEGQRSIRSTISLLLIVPLVSLFALYAYSAYSAVGNALARQNEQQLSNDLGAPVTALYVALDTERADALLYLVNPQAMMAVPGHQATPLATFQAAESATDKAVTGFKSANANAAGLEPSSAQPLLTSLVADLNTLPGLRQQIMNGKISLLSALDAYNNIYAPMSAFSTGFFDSDAPIPLFEQSNAVLQEGEATTSIAEQAALVGAVAATGGNMTAQEHLAFAQAVAEEKQDEAAGSAPIDWQESPDPYPAFWQTPLFQSFEKAQTAIDTASPGVLPSSALQAWNKAITPVIAQETATTGQARVGVTQGQN
ncbi:MAG: nitrate- and nitrite sensing domain-containing protein, partial [Trebonia sp.]